MSRVRRPARPIGALVAVAAIGLCGLLALTNCAAPTQIVVEVFTDACPGSGKREVIHSTGIAVGTADNIESRRPSSTREGCETSTGVGTLVIYPSGDKDEEVAIKVLGGVESAPDRCDPPGYAGCIVHRRMLRFIPNVTQRATVRLTLACLNRLCPSGTTCDNGACVGDRDVRNDGTTTPGADRIEAGVVTPLDAGVPDAADPCAGCKGTCAGGVCTVDCSKVTCAGELCAPTLPCVIACSKAGGCNDIACTTSNKCTIDCGSARDSCEKVTCKADDCDVTCKGDESCNSNAVISLTGTSRAKLACNGKKACKSANLSCKSNDCSLDCNPSQGPDYACPFPVPAGSCTSPQSGGCTDWYQPNGNN